MAEYRNPDISEEWNYINKYSPYHNLEDGMNYPEVFFTTSTRDDRLHPAHARKVTAKMIAMEYPIYFRSPASLLRRPKPLAKDSVYTSR